MKVLAFILAIIGVGGASAVAAPPTPSYVAPPSSVVAAPVAARDAFVRPPRMERTVVVVKPAAAPVRAAKPAVKKTPAPTVKKKTSTVKKTVVRTSSSSGCGASCQWHKTDSVWAKYPAWVQTFALCVSHHESWSPHMWTAENPVSTASGGFQWIDGSWRTNMARAGFSGPGHAAYASPVLQAEVTAWVITHHGQWNWKGTHCGYGT